MENLIYTPLTMVIANKTANNGTYQTCTKINYFGYVISIASDQSLCAGNNLQRTEIRVYKANHDVTDRFVKYYNDNNGFDTNILTSPEDLHFIMDTIREEYKKTFVDKHVLVEKQESLGEPFSTILYDNINDLY